MLEEWLCPLIQQMPLKLLVPSHLVQHHQYLHREVHGLFRPVVPKHLHAEICHSLPKLVEKCLTMVVEFIPRDEDLEYFDPPSNQVAIVEQPNEEGFSSGMGTREGPHKRGAVDWLIVYQQINESRLGVTLPLLIDPVDYLLHEEAGKCLSLKHQREVIKCQCQRDILEELQHDSPNKKAVFLSFLHELRVQLKQPIVEEEIATEMSLHLYVVLALEDQPRNGSQGSFDGISQGLGWGLRDGPLKEFKGEIADDFFSLSRHSLLDVWKRLGQ